MEARCRDRSFRSRKERTGSGEGVERRASERGQRVRSSRRARRDAIVHAGSWRRSSRAVDSTRAETLPLEALPVDRPCGELAKIVQGRGFHTSRRSSSGGLAIRSSMRSCPGLVYRCPICRRNSNPPLFALSFQSVRSNFPVGSIGPYSQLDRPSLLPSGSRTVNLTVRLPADHPDKQTKKGRCF